MSLWTSTRLVAGRELRETFRRKSFWVIAALLLVGATAAMIIPELLRDDSDPEVSIVVVDGDDQLVDLIVAAAQQAELDPEMSNVEQVDTARNRVEEEGADVAVVLGDQPTIIARSGENRTTIAAVRAAVQQRALIGQLRSDGLSSEQISEALQLPTPDLEEVDEEGSGRQAAAFVISFVLYLLLLTLMVAVANGVAIEKANRISEVLLAIVRPGALLFGKVIGVGLGGLAMVAAAAIPVVVKLLIGGSLPEGLGGAVAATAVWFALGLMLYLTLAGALGALVERQEQAGTVTAPLTFVLIATFIVAQSSADTVLGTALAYFPLTSPLMMPTRIAIGAAGPVEIVTSLLLSIAAIAVVGRVGAKMYSHAIVRTGRRLSVREALSAP